MTERNVLHYLKTTAKRIARAMRIPHHEALDSLARVLEHAHWNALTGAFENGWRPSADQLAGLEALAEEVPPAERGDARGELPWFLIPVEEHGTIDGHTFTLSVAFEVFMYGEGWGIIIEHAPSEAVVIEIADPNDTNNPMLDTKFKAKALGIAEAAAELLRERIASDWPRRSTKPDAEGRALHPLGRGLSRGWHCLHCDTVSEGKQMADNMWHCPKCSATPIDIFPFAFWRDEAKPD